MLTGRLARPLRMGALRTPKSLSLHKRNYTARSPERDRAATGSHPRTRGVLDVEVLRTSSPAEIARWQRGAMQ